MKISYSRYTAFVTNPERYRLYYGLGLTLKESGAGKDAIPEFEAVIKLAQQDSNAIRGQMLVLPVEHTLLYVEPIYIQATEARMPQLRKTCQRTSLCANSPCKPSVTALMAATSALRDRS